MIAQTWRVEVCADHWRFIGQGRSLAEAWRGLVSGVRFQVRASGDAPDVVEIDEALVDLVAPPPPDVAELVEQVRRLVARLEEGGAR